MGCGSSAISNAKVSDKYEKESNNSCTESEVTNLLDNEWKVFERPADAHSRYTREGTLSSDANREHLELRSLLDDKISLSALKQYESQLGKSELLACWEKFQELRNCTNLECKRHFLSIIYSNYMVETSPHYIDCFQGINYVIQVSDLLKGDLNEDLLSALIGNLQRHCFCSLYVEVFMSFKISPEYKKMIQILHNKYNRSSIEDYEYFEKIASGSYGIFVQCKKRSTNKVFCMKVQSKIELSCGNKRIAAERKALCNLKSPFIPVLNYAFVTSSLANLVLSPINGCALNVVLNSLEGHRFDESMAINILSQLFCAVSYIHEENYVLRDLKLENLFLCESGLVKIMNLTGISSCVLSTFGDSPLFQQVNTRQQSRGWERSVYDDGGRHMRTTTSMHRLFTIVGTYGYMAPELLIMSTENKFNRDGYTFEVDYWSFGAVAFQLLTGKLPVVNEKIDAVLSAALPARIIHHDVCLNSPEVVQCVDAYISLLNTITYPDYLSANSTSLLSGFLEISTFNRLGCCLVRKAELSQTATPRPNSLPSALSSQNSFCGLPSERYAVMVRTHAFFDGVNWMELDAGVVNPLLRNVSKKSVGKTEISEGTFPVPFQSVIEDDTRAAVFKKTPPEGIQDLFLMWNYVNAENIILENNVCDLHKFNAETPQSESVLLSPCK